MATEVAELLRNRIVAMKLMIRRSKQTGNEVAAAFLGDGNVVIYHDGESTESSSHLYYDIDNEGNLSYKGVDIKGFVHTHPYIDLNNNNPANPLYISQQDIKTALDLHLDDINILFLNGDYYSQGTSGNSIYSPNFKYNINEFK